MNLIYINQIGCKAPLLGENVIVKHLKQPGKS